AVKAEATEGRVLLVGAGPGDPELLTLKAVRALKVADVILYDRLAGTSVLEYARREVELIPVGKAKGEHSVLQGKIQELMIEGARARRSSRGAAQGRRPARVRPRRRRDRSFTQRWHRGRDYPRHHCRTCRRGEPSDSAHPSRHLPQCNLSLRS